MDKTHEKVKTLIKNPRPQREILFSYAGKLFTVAVTYCMKDLFVKHILHTENTNDWKQTEMRLEIASFLKIQVFVLQVWTFQNCFKGEA